MTKKTKPEKKVTLNFKVKKPIASNIKSRAKKYANGNLSLWLTVSSQNYVPKKSDLSPTLSIRK